MIITVTFPAKKGVVKKKNLYSFNDLRSIRFFSAGTNEN